MSKLTRDICTLGTSGRIAVVDVDSTLCQFSLVLYEELVKIEPSVLPPGRWIRWDFWEEYVTKKQFYSAVNRAQDQLPETPMINGASLAICSAARNYHIIISSHRKKSHRADLENWLRKNAIPFDDIFLTYDKSVLFKNPHVGLVIDDSPLVLQSALDEGIDAVGLRYPWNSCMEGSGAVLKNNMYEIEKYVRENLE